MMKWRFSIVCVLVTMAVALSVVDQADAIKCWACQKPGDKDDLMCTERKEQVCEGEIVNCLKVTGKYGAGEHEGKDGETRGCGFRTAKSGCEEKDGEGEQKITTCYCDTDLCNAALPVAASRLVFVLPVAVSLLVKAVVFVV